MIGKLKGIVEAIGESHCVIDVNGVGYEVQASARTLRALKLGEPAALAIDTHVREDAIRLFGFQSEIERSWFRMLQNVQGVGSKVALAVLSVLSPTEMVNAIALGDWSAVERAQGVGRKLAQRITAELKDKAPGLAVAGLPTGSAGLSAASPPPIGSPPSDAAAEAISALSNLGYQPAHATQAVAVATKELGEAADTADLIRRSLKALAR